MPACPGWRWASRSKYLVMKVCTTAIANSSVPINWMGWGHALEVLLIRGRGQVTVCSLRRSGCGVMELKVVAGFSDHRTEGQAQADQTKCRGKAIRRIVTGEKGGGNRLPAEVANAISRTARRRSGVAPRK